MSRLFVLSVALFLALGFGSGCSTHSRTVTTETAYYDSPQDRYQGRPVTVERETTVRTESENPGESTGLVSGTVNVVGEVLALPFRLVGGLISLIF
ncbi:MAG TPA: hypothetical protein VGR30_14480 [Candidatus Binatia bacterium]|jgi:hypothetical protein|nr:hypothetical protein [Candidatus Binatia bacterium]